MKRWLSFIWRVLLILVVACVFSFGMTRCTDELGRHECRKHREQLIKDGWTPPKDNACEAPVPKERYAPFNKFREMTK